MVLPSYDFKSATIDRYLAINYTSLDLAPGITLEITVPAGTPVAPVSILPDSPYPKDYEVLLPRDYDYVIKGTTVIDTGSRYHQVVQVELQKRNARKP